MRLRGTRANWVGIASALLPPASSIRFAFGGLPRHSTCLSLWGCSLRSNSRAFPRRSSPVVVAAQATDSYARRMTPRTPNTEMGCECPSHCFQSLLRCASAFAIEPSPRAPQLDCWRSMPESSSRQRSLRIAGQKENRVFLTRPSLLVTLQRRFLNTNLKQPFS
jgi:hypothetical protein